MAASVDVVDLVSDNDDQAPAGAHDVDSEAAACVLSTPRKAARADIHTTPSKQSGKAQASAGNTPRSKPAATTPRSSKKGATKRPGAGQQRITSFLLKGIGAGETIHTASTTQTAKPEDQSKPEAMSLEPEDQIKPEATTLEPAEPAAGIAQQLLQHTEGHTAGNAGQQQDAGSRLQQQALDLVQQSPQPQQFLQQQGAGKVWASSSLSDLLAFVDGAADNMDQQPRVVPAGQSTAQALQPQSATQGDRPAKPVLMLPAVPLPAARVQQQQQQVAMPELELYSDKPAATQNTLQRPARTDGSSPMQDFNASDQQHDQGAATITEPAAADTDISAAVVSATVKDGVLHSAAGMTASAPSSPLQAHMAQAPRTYSPAAFFTPRSKPATTGRSTQQTSEPLAEAPAAPAQVDAAMHPSHAIAPTHERRSALPTTTVALNAFFTPAKQLRQEQAQQQRAQGGPLFSPAAIALPIQQYDPVAHACWSAATSAPFAHLVHTFSFIDSTTKRLEIGNALTNMFRSLLALSAGAADVVAACYLCTGRIAAAHEPNGEMHIGGATVAAAVRQVTGVTRARMSHLYTQLGDLGDVAQACKRSQVMLRQPPPLTLSGLMSSLRAMASDQGSGSAGRRQRIVEGLLRATRSDDEIKYLVRLLIQNLRVGANWKSVIGPLARAVTIHREGIKSATKAKLDAAAAAASWELLVDALLEGGVQQLKERCSMVAGVPIKPQLARICEGLADAMRILGPSCSFLAEYKYDGRRAQIHLLPDGQVRIFSRHCEDSTAAFPDVVQVLKQAAGLLPTAATGTPANAAASTSASAAAHPAGADTNTTQPAGTSDASSAPMSLVLDAELVGVERDSSTGRITRLCAFQELATRARGEVATHQIGTAVCVFVFDLLFLRGAPLLGHTLRERLSLLPTALPHMRRGFIQPATHTEVILPSQLGVPVKDTPIAPAGATASGSRITLLEDEQQVQLDQQQECAPAAVPGSGMQPHVEDVEDVAAVPAGAAADTDAAIANMASTPLHAAAAHDAGVPQAATEGATVMLQVGTTPFASLQPPQQAAMALQLPADAAAGAGAAAGDDDDDVNTATPPVLRPADAAAAEQLLMELMMQASDAGTEGLVLKRLDGPSSTYEPSKRTDSWVKLKRDYCEGLRDSLDLTVIGAWQGNGRKVSWLSPFLLACWDPVSERLQSVCRCMSGFTDAFYQAATDRLLKTRIPGPKPYFHTGEQCDYWFEPTEVWELRGAELSLSPVHRAAAGQIPGTERGLALRFPRFIRVRDDKRVEDTTGPDTLLSMFMAQNRRAGGV